MGKNNMAAIGLGIGALGLGYLFFVKKTDKGMIPIVKAPEDLAKEPAIRPSASEIKNIATQAAESVNQSVIDAQAKLIDAELKASQDNQKIIDLTSEYNSLVAQKTVATQSYDAINQRLIAANSRVAACQVIYIAAVSAQNIALNNWNAKIGARRLIEMDIARNNRLLIEADYLAWIYKMNLRTTILGLEQDKQALDGPISTAEIIYNNATATVSEKLNLKNIEIESCDAIATELNNYAVTSVNPLTAKILAIQTTINSYAITYAACLEMIKALKKELGI